MSDYPPGYERARDQYENDCNDRPSICDECDQYDTCDRDPVDCDADAAERAAEERWEAAREARD
jgi:hypothetical protein